MLSTEQQALDIFATHPVLRTSELLQRGIHPRTLYKLRDQGFLQQLARGLYMLEEREPLCYPDFVIVTRKIPQAVICLTSALAHHDLTTQSPHRVNIALPAFYREPKLAYPPLEIFRFSEQSYGAGVEYQILDGVEIPIYSAEKSIIDTFKFRNRIGFDVAMESLKLYLARPQRNIGMLLQYAEVCRVERIIRPYLEALL